MELIILYLSPILLAVSTEAGSVRDSFAQCQTFLNQTGQLYSPNIPDRYFSQEVLAGLTAEDLKTTMQFVTHIFSVRAGEICNGSVVAIQYCHRTNSTNVEGMNEVRVFELLHLMELEEMQYLVTGSIQVTSVLNNSICSAPRQGDIQQVCCSTANLRDNEVFQIPTSDFTFGITSRAHQPLTIPENSRIYIAEQFQKYLQIPFPISEGANFTVTEANRKNDTFPLIRFIIDGPGTMLPTATEEDQTTQTAPNSDNSSLTGGEIAAAIIVPLLVVVLGSVIVILLVIVIRRRKSKSDDDDSSRVVHNNLYIKKITSTTGLLSSPESEQDKTATNRSTRMLLQRACSEEEEGEEGRVVENELYGETAGPAGHEIEVNKAYGSMEQVDNLSDQEIDYESVKADGKSVEMVDNLSDQEIDYESVKADGKSVEMVDNLSDQEIEYESLKIDSGSMDMNEAYGTLERNAESQDNVIQESVDILQNALYESMEVGELNESPEVSTNIMHQKETPFEDRTKSSDGAVYENNPAPPTSIDNDEQLYATPPEDGDEDSTEEKDEYIYPHVYTNVNY